jgi:RimJ/RimL family protein N-acetyltransferase
MPQEPILTKRLVLERLGMAQEGFLTERVRKGGVFHDVLLWAIVRSMRVDVGS